MCGFAGFVNIKEKLHENSKTILKNMNESLSKRGPDEDGYFVSDNVYLAHKRLIVIDPDGGKQPMIEHTSYGDYIICYNGQIYNNSIIPSINTSFSWENNTPYSVKNVAISTETVLVKTSDYEDFEIISSFAQKLLTEESFIDEEIQNVINDHFWDML